MYDQDLLLYLSKLKASNCVPCKRSLFYLKDQHHGTICDYSVENLLCSYFKNKNKQNIISGVQGIQFETNLACMTYNTQNHGYSIRDWQI